MNGNATNKFGNWNMIFVGYCDGEVCLLLRLNANALPSTNERAGTSYSSDRADPVNVNGKQVRESDL